MLTGGKLRNVREEDYGAVAGLYTRVSPMGARLSPDAFREMAPRVLVAAGKAGVMGFVLVHRGQTSRVSMVAVAPEAEGQGVGRMMLLELARQLRDQGATRWSLSVKKDNQNALALYSSLGLQEVWSGAYWRLTRRELVELPCDRSVKCRPVWSTEHQKLERTFGLPSHTLADECRKGARIVAADLCNRSQGLARLRVEDGPIVTLNALREAAVRPLLSELWPDEVELAVYSTARVVNEALRAVHAPLMFETVELQGPLPRPTEPAPSRPRPLAPHERTWSGQRSVHR